MTQRQPPDSNRLLEIWCAQIDAMPGEARALLEGMEAACLHPLADEFYTTLLSDPRAASFLSHQKVQDHLKPALVRWVEGLLTATSNTAYEQLAAQRHIGDIHARIGIPLDLVIRGMRVLRRDLLALAASRADSMAMLQAAFDGISVAMDISLEEMTLAYSRAHSQSSQRDTTFRLFSLIDNASTERERQRALLLDWENSLLYALASGTAIQDCPSLSGSEFGLWFLHKGQPSFGDSTATRRIVGLMNEIDELLFELQRQPDRSQEQIAAALQGIRNRTDKLGRKLGQMFERIHELDAGHDPLTNLLNRRFLPTVMRREIDLAKQTGSSFALVMIDLDRFKQLNDMHGHAVGDQVLQHVASLLSQTIRGSDYLFRLGGEELLVVLASVTAEQAAAIAEKLRHAIASEKLVLPDDRTIAVTASFGVAVYDGHPDYARLLSRADAAMYRAKQGGRDRVEIAAV